MGDVLEESHRQDERSDALLLGRRTSEDFRGRAFRGGITLQRYAPA